MDAGNKIVIACLVSLSILFLLFNQGLADDREMLGNYLAFAKDRIINVSDLDREVAWFFFSEVGDKNPGLLIGDFNADKVTDAATLQRAINTNDLRLIIVTCINKCEEIANIDVGKFNGLQYLTIFDEKDYISESNSLGDDSSGSNAEIIKPAIHFITYGKSSVAFGWNLSKNTFVPVTTGD